VHLYIEAIGPEFRENSTAGDATKLVEHVEHSVLATIMGAILDEV
jgi:hypothetical protein